MAINTDGPKRNGKFLKKGSKILKAVQLTNYSFNFLNEEPNIEFDNLERTIIHTRLHDPAEVERNVRDSDRLKEVLFDPNLPRMPIIMPGDFTQDWFNERMNSKRRALGFEDEDDFDYPDISTRNGSSSSSKPSAKPDSAANSASGSAAAPKKVGASTADIQSINITPAQADLPAEEIVKLAKPVSIVKEPYSAKNIAEVEKKAQEAAHASPVESAKETAESDDFIPLGSGKSEDQAQSVEDVAIAKYKSRAEIESQHAEILEELKNASRAEGYAEGFRTGEEKGVVAGQNTAAEIFNRVSELIHEFEGLKGNVLENIQRNFYELSQAVAESLLEREFSINPQSFAKVLEKVLKDTVSDNEFKVRLHPETWQRVHDLNIPTLEGHLVKDTSIALGEFKVESNLTVVDGNVKKIVAQMLQNVDMNLFEETKIAG